VACRALLRTPTPDPRDPDDHLPCLHRGEWLGDQPCRLCGQQDRTVPVYACSVRSRCVLNVFDRPGQMAAAGLTLCNDCPDRRPPTDGEAARLDACRACDQLIDGRCTLTGRRVKDAVANCDAQCPIGRWPGEEARTKQAHGIQSSIAAPWHSKVCLVFPHGFGDHVQLTTVLLHLAALRPDLTIDVCCRAGCETLYRGLCRQAFRWGTKLPDRYDLTVPLEWFEPDQTYSDSPSTKAEKCLREVFGLTPITALCRYACEPDDAAIVRAARYLRRVGGAPGLPGSEPVALVHYQGRCGRRLKDIPEAAIVAACDALMAAGIRPLILDWDGTSELVSRGAVINAAADAELWPDGWGDAATLAALAAQARLCVGIDSGPGHLFGATRTPTLIVWSRLHPVNYYGLANNVTHFVPHHHGRWIRGDRTTGERYFTAHYTHQVYRHLKAELPAAVTRLLAQHPE
jgi:hypothetical protein